MASAPSGSPDHPRSSSRMVLDRRSALAGALAGLLACGWVAGCGGSHGSTAERPTPSIATSAGSPVSASTGSASPSYSISIPPYLCSNTDVAQNAADAYLGALSAGQLDQA